MPPSPPPPRVPVTLSLNLRAERIDGKAFVVVNIATAQGENDYWFPADVAVKIGEAITDAGRKTWTGLEVVRNGVTPK